MALAAPIRLIATDLDGTLLRSDKTVSPRVRAALDAAQRQGILVIIATARPPLTAREFAAMAGVDGVVICANGAITYDLTASAMLSHRTIDLDAARTLVTTIRDRLPGVCFGVVQGEAFACEAEYASLSTYQDHGAQLDTMRVCEIDLFFDRPMTKLVMRHSDHHPTVLIERVAELNLTGFEVNFSGAPFIEIVGGGVSKAQALADLCAANGILATEVIAFGDAPNDLPMLRWAGHGVAVGAKYPQVGAEADEIAPSSDDDGVALVLERVLGPTS